MIFLQAASFHLESADVWGILQLRSPRAPEITSNTQNRLPLLHRWKFFSFQKTNVDMFRQAQRF